MKRRHYLLLVASQMLAACTPMDLVRSAAWSMGAPARADDVDPDELFWNPAVISDENCPEINGKFRAPPLHYDVGFFSANVPDVKKRYRQ